MAKGTYEVRALDNPQTMPRGNGTISRHRTAEAAFRAISEAVRRLRRRPGQSTSYLSRVVVHVAGDRETIVRSDESNSIVVANDPDRS